MESFSSILLPLTKVDLMFSVASVDLYPAGGGCILSLLYQIGLNSSCLIASWIITVWPHRIIAHDPLESHSVMVQLSKSSSMAADRLVLALPFPDFCFC